MNILIVDDEKEIADLVELVLKNEGYNVLKFYNSLDAYSNLVHNDNIDELVIIAKAKYVHELQHALRLAGNTREIEL